LHQAAQEGHTAIASYLVDIGTEVDVRNRVGGCMYVFWLDRVLHCTAAGQSVKVAPVCDEDQYCSDPFRFVQYGAKAAVVDLLISIV
jgi:hypothetical protein